MADQSETRQRLAVLMEARRLDLRLTWQEVAENGNVSLRALATARTGDSDIRPLTRRSIDKGLEWEPGSVDRILAGGEPEPYELPDLTDEMREALKPWLADVRAAVARARRRHPRERLTGRLVFPDSPRDAASWDRFTADGYPAGLIIHLMAGVLEYQREADQEAQGNNSAAFLRLPREIASDVTVRSHRTVTRQKVVPGRR